MSRVGYVTMRLAELLSAYSVGDQIPKVQTLARELDCGNGTIQAAFGVLDQANAITLKSRGHLGTFISQIDHSVLWELSGSRSVSIAMPLPYSRRYEALATGLQKSFIETELPLTLAFMRGSTQRVRALREGRVDLVLMSGMAAHAEENLEIVHDFGPQSYVAAHGLLIAKGKDPGDDKLRVGVDPESADQVRLVANYFPDLPSKQLVPLSYNQLDHSFKEGHIDATVWNLDEVNRTIKSEVDMIPIPEIDEQQNTHAVVVRPKSGLPVAVGVLQAITADTVTRCIDAVMAGDMTPTY